MLSNPTSNIPKTSDVEKKKSIKTKDINPGNLVRKIGAYFIQREREKHVLVAYAQPNVIVRVESIGLC